MYRFLSITAASIIISVIPLATHAQMFSVDESRQQQVRPIGYYSILGASLEYGDFSYIGTGAEEDQRADFNGPIIRFRFENPGLDLTLGFGGSLTGMENAAYTNISGRLYNDLNLTRRHNFRLALPFQITTDMKSVRKSDSNAEFQQSSFTFGTGLASALRLGNKVDLTLRGTPNYGFSFAQGSLFGGSLFRFDGRARIIFAQLIGNDSFSVGYHFDYRRYNIDGDLNDYDYLSHSFTIGYAF